MVMMMTMMMSEIFLERKWKRHTVNLRLYALGLYNFVRDFNGGGGGGRELYPVGLITGLSKISFFTEKSYIAVLAKSTFWIYSIFWDLKFQNAVFFVYK